MSKRAKALLGAFVAVVAAGTASSAVADAGSGIRLGGSDGRLHPSLEVESRSDSNVIYWTPGQSVSDVILHIRPGLTLTVPGELTAVDLHAALDWAQYLGVEGHTSDLSRLYGDASLGIGVNRRGQLGLELNDDFFRRSNTSVMSFGTAVIANNNALRVAMPWKPGGGALLLTLGGEWELETYEPYATPTLCGTGELICEPGLVSKFGWNELRGTGELKWKFLPRTAVVLDGSYFSRLANDNVYSPDLSGFRTEAGLTGLVTQRIAGTVKAGYGQTFGNEALRTWLANAEFEWLATETSAARVGFSHDYGTDPGWILSLFQSNRVYVDGHVLLGGRFTARLGASLERREYESVAAHATLFRIEPAFEAEVTRAFRAVLGYAYTDRASNVPAGTLGLPGYNYSKNEFWLRGVVSY
ncbi:outer membrane beta-barrel protein [Anaeromyxobacter oryzae]|uniref:Uncharacterized protein n=1 Tax=Anaeromyxobacter oryzae TaxID=2918170 RepID=A0ABM7WSR1_9BACT|nr:outer membrane beta-barrel protein [Anaeromyxobacter oryzae]BDG02533.1 hypothetical protein AMOR_15290 [Anaeromyxobacter oryzae]